MGSISNEQTKRQKEARKKQKVISIKEVRMSPKIEEHDFQVKVKNAERFLKMEIRLRSPFVFEAGKLSIQIWLGTCCCKWQRTSSI